MKALRIVLTQTSANYRKEETLDNKMTYPLPPLSTIIGAIHNACGYKEYKDMDISIQGKYGSMNKEPYTDYCFLNSTMDDRGILVKMKNESMLSNAFEKVAKANKPKVSNIRNNISILIYNQELLEEYQSIKKLGDKIKDFNNKRIKPLMTLIKKRKKSIADHKKLVDKESSEYVLLVKRENEIKSLEKEINSRLKEYKEINYTVPVAQYRSLITSLKFYEVLNDIKLILHIRASDEILNCINENIYNLKSIGRSEDFVNIENAEIINIENKLPKDEYEITSNYSAYLDLSLARKEHIFTKENSNSPRIYGTKYSLNKNYRIEDGKRIFEKKKVIYASEYTVVEESENIFFDKYNDEIFIVNML